MIAHQTGQRDIAGQSTQIVLQTYADRIFVLVTQVGKVGNLIQASLPPTTPASVESSDDTGSNSGLPQPSPAIQLTPLLGSSPSDHLQTLHSLYVSQIATIVWVNASQNVLDGSRKCVIVGLALRKAENSGTGYELSEGERATFQGVMAMLQEMLEGKLA